MNLSNQKHQSKSIAPLAASGEMSLLIGQTSSGPSRCIQCCKPFMPGEAWRRLRAESDPEHGTYSIGIHERCAGNWPIKARTI